MEESSGSKTAVDYTKGTLFCNNCWKMRTKLFELLHNTMCTTYVCAAFFQVSEIWFETVVDYTYTNWVASSVKILMKIFKTLLSLENIVVGNLLKNICLFRVGITKWKELIIHINVDTITMLHKSEIIKESTS